MLVDAGARGGQGQGPGGGGIEGQWQLPIKTLKLIGKQYFFRDMKSPGDQGTRTQWQLPIRTLKLIGKQYFFRDIKSLWSSGGYLEDTGDLGGGLHGDPGDIVVHRGPNGNSQSKH